MPTTRKTTPKKASAPAKSKTTKTTKSRAGTTVKRATSAKKAAVSPAKKKPASAKKISAEKETPSAGIGLVRRCVAALEEKKASDISVFFLGEKSPVTDFCVIATGTSDPHLRSLRIALEKAVEEVVPAGRIRIQNEPGSGWCVVDAFDVVVHIFSEAQRKNYDLESLWKDGDRIVIE